MRRSKERTRRGGEEKIRDQPTSYTASHGGRKIYRIEKDKNPGGKVRWHNLR